MARTKRFTLLLSTEERMLIDKLADILQRSQGDAIRFILRQDLERRGLLANDRTIENLLNLEKGSDYKISP